MESKQVNPQFSFVWEGLWLWSFREFRTRAIRIRARLALRCVSLRSPLAEAARKIEEQVDESIGLDFTLSSKSDSLRTPLIDEFDDDIDDDDDESLDFL